MSAVGDRLTYNGQVYNCIAVEPHLTKDGRSSYFSIWRSACAEPGCDADFDQTWRPDFPRGNPSIVRRCAIHRKPGVAVDPRYRRPAHAAAAAGAEWLYRARLADPETFWTIRNALAALKQHYATMPVETAKALGMNAKSESSRYTQVRRRLLLAERMGMLIGHKGPDATVFWEIGADFIGVDSGDPDET